MDYEEATAATVTREEARREVERHSCDFAEFVAEVGDSAVYRGSEVLGWLGY